MYELSKTVLAKVSFDKQFFCKELAKAIERILPHEKIPLMEWCLDVFHHEYKKEIEEIFQKTNYRAITPQINPFLSNTRLRQS